MTDLASELKSDIVSVLEEHLQKPFGLTSDVWWHLLVQLPPGYHHGHPMCRNEGLPVPAQQKAHSENHQNIMLIQ